MLPFLTFNLAYRAPELGDLMEKNSNQSIPVDGRNPSKISASTGHAARGCDLLLCSGCLPQPSRRTCCGFNGTEVSVFSSVTVAFENKGSLYIEKKKKTEVSI